MIFPLIHLLVWLIVVGIVCWLAVYVIDAIPLPQPINRVAKIVVTVIACLILIVLLLQLVGMAPPMSVR